jgi:RNA polymerase sigma-70 factor (ECF subfamily)
MSRRLRVDQPRRLVSLEALLPAPGNVRTLEVPALGKNPEEVVINAALRRRLATALRRLPPALRMVVFLREMEGLSTREASQTLGVSEETVRARLHRARLFLQRELEGPRTGRPRSQSPARPARVQGGA